VPAKKKSGKGSSATSKGNKKAAAGSKAASWFDWGYAGIDEEVKRLKAMRPESDRPRELIITDGEDLYVYWISEQPFCYHAHSVKRTARSGKPYWIHQTCLKPEKCPYCEMAEQEGSPVARSSYYGLYTVIDCREWEDSRGNVHTNERKIFRCFIGRMQSIARIEGKKGSFAGHLVNIMRSGKEYQFLKDNDTDLPEGVSKKEAVDYDYAELFAPQGYEEAMNFLGRAQTPTSDTSIETEDLDEDLVPLLGEDDDEEDED